MIGPLHWLICLHIQVPNTWCLVADNSLVQWFGINMGFGDGCWILVENLYVVKSYGANKTY